MLCTSVPLRRLEAARCLPRATACHASERDLGGGTRLSEVTDPKKGRGEEGYKRERSSLPDLGRTKMCLRRSAGREEEECLGA